jgi:hypothetical protein
VARPATFANRPVGTLHSFKNETDRPARMLISVVPAGLEELFFEVGHPVPAGAGHSRAIEVLRRQPDGTWLLLVGDPDGRG